MARLSKKEFETLFRQLGYLRKDADQPQCRELLERGLGAKNGHLALRAAKVIRENELPGWEAEMETAYFALFENSAKDDPGCLAKIALAEALEFADHQGVEPFLRGVDFVQRESAGPGGDAAAGLRVRCGLALVRLRVPDALVHMANLLADGEPSVRAAAPGALAFHGDEAGAALLRLKLLLGDTEFEVTLRCLQAYVALDQQRGMVMAEEMFSKLGAAERSELALGLADSKLPCVFGLLRKNLSVALEERHVHAGILALVTLRTKESMDHVATLARGEDPLRSRIANELLG